MAEASFLFGELDQLIENMEEEAKNYNKRSKAMMKKQIRKLRRDARARARAQGIKKQTGTYQKSIKQGKVWRKDGDTLSARIYSDAPHAHLLEEGHDMVVNPGKGRGNGHGVIPGKGIGRKVGHIDATWVFDSALKALVPQFEEAVEDMLDEVVRGICR